MDFRIWEPLVPDLALRRWIKHVWLVYRSCPTGKNLELYGRFVGVMIIMVRRTEERSIYHNYIWRSSLLKVWPCLCVSCIVILLNNFCRQFYIWIIEYATNSSRDDSGSSVFIFWYSSHLGNIMTSAYNDLVYCWGFGLCSLRDAVYTRMFIMINIIDARRGSTELHQKLAIMNHSWK